MTETSPEYTAYEKGYKDGRASANAKIEPLIREIHDLVFEQGKEMGRAEMCNNIINKCKELGIDFEPIVICNKGE